MRELPADSSIDGPEEAVVHILQSLPPWEKVAMIGRANAGWRALLGIAVRRTHPDWTDEQVREETGRLILDDDKLWAKAQAHRDTSIRLRAIFRG